MRHVYFTLIIALGFGGVLLYSLFINRYSTNISRVPMSSASLANVNLNWFPPTSSWITNLTTVVNGTGTYGFNFAGSEPTSETSQAVSHEYNYCNMPRVRRQEYQVPDKTYELIYVELVRL
jgi:acid phosphatase